MKLEGKDIAELINELDDGFITLDAFDSAIVETNRSVDGYAGPNDVKKVAIRKVVEGASSEQWLQQLLKAVLNSDRTENNERLRSLITQLLDKYASSPQSILKLSLPSFLATWVVSQCWRVASRNTPKDIPRKQHRSLATAYSPFDYADTDRSEVSPSHLSVLWEPGGRDFLPSENVRPRTSAGIGLFAGAESHDLCRCGRSTAGLPETNPIHRP